MKVYIYTLSDPRTNAIRYVGKTIDPKMRIRSHLSDGAKTHKGAWIRLLKSLGLSPIFEIVELVDLDNWSCAEKFWVDYLRFLGFSLTNLMAGGIGMGVHCVETRAKMSASQKARAPMPPRSKDHCLAISLAKKGKSPTPETRLKMSMSQKGRKHSEDTKRKIAESHKAHPRIQAAITAAAKIRKGMKLPKEWRLKMSRARTGVKIGPWEKNLR